MRKSRVALGFCFVSLLAFTIANSAKAQVVVYNTIHPVTIEQGWEGLPMYPPTFHPEIQYTYLATSFVPSGSYELTRIDVEAVFNNLDLLGDPQATNSGAVVELLSDAGGQPGTVLESWTISPPLPSTGYGAPQLLTPTSTIQLSDGTRYWLAMSQLGATGIADWNVIIPANFGTPTLGSHDGSTWTTVSEDPVPAFDVWGNPTGATKFLYLHRGFGQTIRLKVVAGPTSVPPGVPVEAVLGFLDTNGNPTGPTKMVSLAPGQEQSLDLTPGASTQGDVLPVITPVAGAASINGEIRGSAEVFDTFLGIGTVFEAGQISIPDAPVFAPQGLAGGQTMRLTVFSRSANTCIATLGFEDSTGNPIGPTMPVNLTGGRSASLDLNADSLGLRLGQRVEIQPMVVAGLPAGAAEPQALACPASTEVFDHLTGRTETYQPGEANLGPITIPGAATPVSAQ